jgi:DNA-binding SARP family transcriptional activator
LFFLGFTEAAANAVDEAEGALRQGDRRSAWSHSNVVVSIARRPFLQDEEAAWIESRRSKLRGLLVRGLHCLSVISASQGEEPLALQYANEILELEPFRETAYQHLMRLHSRMGNRAEALRVFGQCRELLKEELGASPSPETEALFLEILRGNG